MSCNQDAADGVMMASRKAGSSFVQEGRRIQLYLIAQCDHLEKLQELQKKWQSGGAVAARFLKCQIGV